MKLLIYQGGGYSGCFWEWNACLFDEAGNFIDLFSSGKEGVKSAREFELRFGKHLPEDTDVTPFDDPQDEADFAVYDIGLKSEIERFLDDKWNPTVQLTLLKALDREQEQQMFHLCCDMCGTEIWEADETATSGYAGCGGIAITATDVICRNCKAERTCSHCGEWIPSECTMYGELCDYCYRTEVEDQMKQLIELFRTTVQITPHCDILLRIKKQYEAAADELERRLKEIENETK